MAANSPSSADPADLIPITSPVIAHLPELLDAHRLGVHLHKVLLACGEDLPAVLSGWVLAEVQGQLAEARKALEAALRIVAEGKAERGESISEALNQARITPRPTDTPINHGTNPPDPQELQARLAALGEASGELRHRTLMGAAALVSLSETAPAGLCEILDCLAIRLKTAATTCERIEFDTLHGAARQGGRGHD